MVSCANDGRNDIPDKRSNDTSSESPRRARAWPVCQLGGRGQGHPYRGQRTQHLGLGFYVSFSTNKKTRLPEEMADSRTEEGRKQGEPETLCTRK